METNTNYQYQKISTRQLSIILLLAFLFTIIIVMAILGKKSSTETNTKFTTPVIQNAIQSSKVIKKPKIGSSPVSSSNQMITNFEKTGEMTFVAH